MLSKFHVLYLVIIYHHTLYKAASISFIGINRIWHTQGTLTPRHSDPIKVLLTQEVVTDCRVVSLPGNEFDVAYHFQGSLLHPFMGISRGELDSIPVMHPTVINAHAKLLKLLLYTRVLSFSLYGLCL